MLKTIYSNAYEILEAYLTAEISEDKKASVNPFERVRVISGNSNINNRLRQHLAKTNGICSGVDFWTTQSWFHNYAGIGVGEPEEAQDFLWVIWSVLTDRSIADHPRLNTFFSHRTSAREKALARYELARKIATVFDKYVNYRFDWVAEWMGFTNVKAANVYKEVNAAQISKEKLALESHPDFAWQKAIWQKLSETTVWAGRETLRLYANPESLEIKFANEPETLHFFEPGSISPLMLPIIKLLSEHDHKIYVYLLNPCVDYWFDSYADINNQEEQSLNFLRKNAASTRALINRFWTFTPEGQEHADHAPEKLPDLTAAPLQKLNIWTRGETERLDLVQDSGSLLHAAQRAVLENKTDYLPSTLRSADQSIRIIKAPTLTREVQNAINMIQDFFQDKTLDLKPEDVLIVTPEIDKTAPVFEACMQALPPQYRMDYQIFGNGANDVDMSAQSLVQLGQLLMRSFTLGKLNEWLELPMVGRCLELSLDDLNVLHSWLLAAGFREGINNEHIKTLHPDWSEEALKEDEDGTLTRAIERLSWGFILKENTHACVGDILPIQEGCSGFTELAENQKLFQILCLLSEKLTEALQSMKALGEEALPAELSLWAHSLLDSFFAEKADRAALMSIRSSLRIQELALTTVPEPITMPLYVYWRALEDRISAPYNRNPAVGRITLSSMSNFRGLPYKVIIAIGMGESSGFPGNQRFEEFDLMGADSLKRQNDRDSRSDNRNVFLDLFLAARDRFVCSYCVGSDKKSPLNPSPVVIDLMDFLSRNIVPQKDETQLKAIARELENITAEITLTDTAAENFQSTPVRFWKSFMQETLLALKEAQGTDFQAPEPVMLRGSLNKENISNTLYIEDILAFFKDPAKWLQKRLDFRFYEDQLQESVPLFGEQSSLEMSILRKSAFEMLEDGENHEAILKRIELDPMKGSRQTRRLQYEDAVNEVVDAYELKEEILSYGEKKIINRIVPLKNKALFTQLNAEGIEAIRFKIDSENKIDESSWIGSVENNQLYLLECCTSKSAVSLAYAKLAIIRAMGINADMLIIQTFETPVTIVKGIELSCARSFTQEMIHLMLEVMQNGCVITSSFDNDTEEIIWRGRDYSNTKALSTELWKLAVKIITPDTVYPKMNSYDRCRHLEDFEDQMEIFISGEWQ